MKYEFDGIKGRYKVLSREREMFSYGPVYRPTRNAAGMTKTAGRSLHKLDGDALRLAVMGTMDRVGNSFRFKIVPIKKVTYRLRKNMKKA